MADLIQRLRERKLVQWALAYGASAFALIQILDIVAQRFGWTEQAMRLVIIALAIGFFVALVLAWYHGERGAQRVTGTELLIVALLLSIGGVIAWRLAPGEKGSESISGADAGAANPQNDSGRMPGVPNAPVDRKSIAVLPFNDMSPAHDQEYFSDGMAEELLNALAKVKDLQVAGRTSSFSFKGKNQDLRTIGKALGVANILEGSVRKQGDRVRITAQLVRTDNDFHLWSETYDGDLSDVFELQERIARAITDQLKVVLAAGQKDRLVPVATSNAEAHALYLQATAVFNRRDGAHFPEAIVDLKQAIRLDPNYARAHARLASLHVIANNYTGVDQAESLAACEHEAGLAIGLDPSLAEPHAALGTMHEYRREWLPARVEAERAVELDPSDTLAQFWLGLNQVDAGYLALGTATIDHALSIDPLLPNALGWRAYLDFEAGNPDSSRRRAQLSVEQGLVGAERQLAMLARAEGRNADAIALFTRGAKPLLIGFPDDASAVLARGLYGDGAERARAIAMVDAYLAARPRVVTAAAPWALLQLGEPVRALALAQDPQTSNDTLFLTYLWTSPGTAARRSPQFTRFVHAMGLPDVWARFGPPDKCRQDGGDYVCE
jgi:TolB-like protein